MYAVSSRGHEACQVQSTTRRRNCGSFASHERCEPHDHQARDRGLPLAARRAAPARPAQRGDRRNGSGKSSLYRALRLLADIAQGRIIQSLAAEGGLHSTLWAGPERLSRAVKRGDHPVQGTVRRNPISLKLGFAGTGLRLRHRSRLAGAGLASLGRDPEIKTESQWTGETLGRANAFAVRNGPLVRIRGDAGEWRQVFTNLAPFDSMMTHCSDPREAPELLLLRERMRDWRFYDHFRTDREAPARRPQVGTYTPVLASDGADLAAAIETIREIGGRQELGAAIADAFPGASCRRRSTDGLFELEMHQSGLLRPLHAAELSDGTLRYLLLCAALSHPASTDLMILNEPETSLAPRFAGTARSSDRPGGDAIATRRRHPRGDTGRRARPVGRATNRAREKARRDDQRR